MRQGENCLLDIFEKSEILCTKNTKIIQEVTMLGQI